MVFKWIPAFIRPPGTASDLFCGPEEINSIPQTQFQHRIDFVFMALGGKEKDSVFFFEHQQTNQLLLGVIVIWGGSTGGRGVEWSRRRT